MPPKKVQAAGGKGGWLAAAPSKAAAEAFFLRYSIYWIGVFGVVVVTGVYHVLSPQISVKLALVFAQHFTDWMFMALGLVLALPSMLYPLLFPFPVRLHLSFTGAH